MTINYDIVRIGKPRKDSNSERILYQNVKFLKFDIECLLQNSEENNLDIIPITIVIPASGFNVLFDVRDIDNKVVKTVLSNHFKSRLFDQNKSILIGQNDNQII